MSAHALTAVCGSDGSATSRLAALASSAVAVPAASASQASPAAAKSIVQGPSGDPQFSTLVGLLKKAGLVEALSRKSKLTVFAPTNAPSSKLPEATLKKVRSDKQLLTSILTYHVVKGAVPASRVVKLAGKSVKTLDGKTRQDPRLRRQGLRQQGAGHQDRREGLQRRHPRHQPGPDP